MADTRTLYTLQRVDSRIDAIRARLEKIERAIAQDRVLQAAIAAHDQAVSAHRQWQTRLQDLELQRRSLREETETSEQRLYSGRVANPRELNDLQDKVGELKKRFSALEDPIFEAMEAVEEASKREVSTAAELADVKATRAETISKLSDDHDALNAQLEKYLDRLEQVREKIDGETLALYDELRSSSQGTAVTLMKDGICGGCGVEIEQRMAQKVRHGEIRQCTTCWRILYEDR